MPDANPFSLFHLPGGQLVRDTGTLLELEPYLAEHGLLLTRPDAARLLETSARTLSALGRFELDTGVLCEIARRLAASGLITQEGYVRAVEDLYEAFHSLKNQTSDQVSDEELLDALFAGFTKYEGSVELVLGRGAERIVENHRRGDPLADFAKRQSEQDEEDEYWAQTM